MATHAASSPLATGGAGTDFEREVGAFYLAALLLGSTPLGAAGGVATRVLFQQRVAGAPLDDVVVETEAAGAAGRLELQIKRRFTFGAGDPEYAPVLRDCWDTFVRIGDQPAGRFGVATGPAALVVRTDYVRVPQWAQASTSAEHFFDRLAVRGASSAPMRRFVDDVRTVLAAHAGAALTVDAFWRFLRQLVLVEFDFGAESSADVWQTRELLRRAAPAGDPATALRIHDRLLAYVRAGNHVGGGYTAVDLRRRLAEDGIPIAESPDLRRDLKRVAAASRQTLDGIDDSIGPVALDRSELTSHALSVAATGGVTFVVGDGGVGKSALAKAVALTRMAQGPVLAVSARSLDGVVGWQGLAARWRLDGDLDELILAMGGAARPCLMIDGVDFVDQPGARAAVNDLLRAVAATARAPDGAPRWTVLMTARREGVAGALAWLDAAGQPAHVITVELLGRDELDVLAAHLPHLTALLRPEREGDVPPVLRTPYFLAVLEQSRAVDGVWPAQARGDNATGARGATAGAAAGVSSAPPSSTPGGTQRHVATSEADVHRVWWTALVGRHDGPGGLARREALLAAGRAALGARSSGLTGVGVDPDALASLALDGVLRRDPLTDRYQFGHDILEEWSAARALAQRLADLPSYLAELGEPFWADRALQLLACTLLEASVGEQGGVGAWAELLAAIETAEATRAAAPTASEPDAAVENTLRAAPRQLRSPRWSEAVLTAPLRSIRLYALLTKIGPTLLADNGRRLATLLRAVQTDAVRSDPAIEALLREHGASAAARAAAAVDYGVPIVAVWFPLLLWLAPQLESLPIGARAEASRLMLLWIRRTAPDMPFRREVAEAALAWRRAPQQVLGAAAARAIDGHEYYDRLREVIAASAGDVPEQIPGFLRELAGAGNSHATERWIADQPSPVLAQHAPAAYADFVLDVLAPGWREADLPRVRREAALRSRVPGIEDGFAFVSASHLRGPFLHLLRASEAEGLRLVRTLTERATAGWRVSDLQWAVEFWHQVRDGDVVTDTPAEEAQASEPPTADDAAFAVVPLPDGTRRFWGDAGVYAWYRGYGSAPYSVVSALMALEVWMEEQVAGGRDPSELFRTVLEGVTSVALVGVCVAVALGDVERCLRAAVPFVSSWALWEYDLTRHTHDSNGAAELLTSFGSFGADLGADAVRARRNRPQRRLTLRDTMAWYVFSNDAELRGPVVAAVRAFPDDLSSLTPHERASAPTVAAHRTRMEAFVGLAERENYRFGVVNGQQYVQFVQAPHVLTRHEPQMRAFEALNRHLALRQWADATRAAGAPAPGKTVEEAVVQAREAEQPGDRTTAPRRDDHHDTTRRQAVAAVAVAVAVVAPDWLAAAPDAAAWCRGVLTGAATAERAGDGRLYDAVPEDPVVAAAVGLPALARHGLADSDSRLAVLHLAASTDRHVADPLFTGVRAAWAADPSLSASAVALALSLALRRTEGRVRRRHRGYNFVGFRDEAELRRRDKEARRARRLVTRYTGAVRDGHVPPLPPMLVRRGGQRLSASRAIPALSALPLEALAADPAWQPGLLRLTDDLVAWTVAEQVAHHARRVGSRGFVADPFQDYHWTPFLGDWLAALAQVLPDALIDAHVLAPVRKGWPATAPLSAALLAGYVRHHLVPASAARPVPAAARRQWEAIVEWVVPAEPLPAWRRPDRVLEEALDLALGVHHGRAQLTDASASAASLVVAGAERWVRAVAHVPAMFPTLLAFLAAMPSTVGAPRAVQWIADAVARTPDRAALWRERDVPARTGEVLGTYWAQAAQAIRRDSATMARYVELVEELARVGVALAAQLRADVR